MILSSNRFSSGRCPFLFFYFWCQIPSSPRRLRQQQLSDHCSFSLLLPFSNSSLLFSSSPLQNFFVSSFFLFVDVAFSSSPVSSFPLPQPQSHSCATATHLSSNFADPLRFVNTLISCNLLQSNPCYVLMIPFLDPERKDSRPVCIPQLLTRLLLLILVFTELFFVSSLLIPFSSSVASAT